MNYYQALFAKSGLNKVFFILSLLGIFSHFFICKNVPLVLVIFIAGLPLILNIIIKMFKKDLGADLLAMISIIVAFYLNEYLAATLIIAMLSSGQLLESFAVKKASFALLALAERMPVLAHVRRNNQEVNVAVEEIDIGDLVLVYPHEVCPVDGVVVEGYGSMDESYLTGEPYLLSKAPGAFVLSGAKNSNSLLLIKATKKTKDSRYAKIMQVMEDAEQKRPQMRRLADQLGAIFAPISLIFALCAWFITGNIQIFLSILMVATPCPLLIAIPITIISAISLASKRGIIIKDPLILEKLPSCKTAIFDKTGTLTYGQAEIYEIENIGNFSENEIIKFSASIERYSKHPLALAIVNYAQKKGLEYCLVKEISEIAGEGIKGDINGLLIQIIDRKSFLKLYKDQEHLLFPIKHGLECLVIVNNKFEAVIRFRDSLRKEGSPFISHLAPVHNFDKIMLVSGDRLSEVEYLAEKLGIKEALSNQTPEQKVKIVQNETKKAPTLFVGDGINDAPALAVATCGIAFGHSNKVTSEAGGAVILDSSLVKVDELIHISESMKKIALQSAIGGMFFAVVGMFFAAFGYITPVMGALIQEVIDVFAILNALRLIFWNNIQTHV